MAKISITGTRKLTNYPWLNLYQTDFLTEGGHSGAWLYASRHEPHPTPRPDAVVIVPMLPGALVLEKEYRVPIRDYEIHFPAGLISPGETVESTARRELLEETGFEITKIKRISPPLVSSAGLSDESVCVVFAECEHRNVQQELEVLEDIEVLPVGLAAIRGILEHPPCSIDAKCWHILHMFDQLGGIK